MSDSISPREFREAEGTKDWRVVGDGARAYFTTGSFLAGAAFVAAIAGLADAANHYPDVGDISERDVALARRISAAARELGILADPAAVQSLQVATDAFDVAAVQAFWRAVFG